MWKEMEFVKVVTLFLTKKLYQSPVLFCFGGYWW